MRQKINYIQIIFHLIATYFLVFSFQSFAWIHDVKLINLTETYGAENIVTNHEKYGIGLEEIALFTFWPRLACLIGILFAFLLSIAISKMKKWSILNSFVILLISYFLYRFDILSWKYSKSFLSVNRFIDDYQTIFILNGSCLLIIGLVIFFSKWTNRLIQNQYQEII
ncbi:hypothetical protein [Flavobacterium ajazii]|uniref:hypothetical protein n=1 Tax=Flavobacterium ajazii TaxID=2692318 RepID=UPI0013D8118F|nr:hypothetical protein [Flavobacterium ajazii]